MGPFDVHFTFIWAKIDLYEALCNEPPQLLHILEQLH